MTFINHCPMLNAHHSRNKIWLKQIISPTWWRKEPFLMGAFPTLENLASSNDVKFSQMAMKPNEMSQSGVYFSVSPRIIRFSFSQLREW